MSERVTIKQADRDRFWAKVRQTHTCWAWTGWHSYKGYSFFYFAGRDRLAHRFVYELFNGPIPEGLVIDHLCRNRGCVNPAHLEAVTQSENIRRGDWWKTQCPQGHPYSPENTRMVRVGKYQGKVCRICSRENGRRWNRKRAERRRMARV